MCFEDADLYPKGQPIFLEKKEVLVDLAEEVAELFDFIPPWDSPRLNRAWQEVFHAANFRPRVHGAARLLANRLDARYGPKFLAWALCPTDGDAKDNWIVKFVRNPAKEADPLRHLVVLHAIGHKLSELVEYGSNILSHPRVDDSKLKCVNPICGCFGQAYRKQTHIFRHPHLREEVAHHTCLTCYQTVEQRLLPARQGEPVRIVDRGELWSNELSRLWQDPKLSIRQIGKRLGAESLTIKRHAVKAGLAFPRKGLRISRKKPRVGQVKPRPSQGMYAEKRQGWLKVLKSQKSLSAARRKVPAIYAWLRRNDRDWMIAHRPARILLSSQGACRVDWKAREQGFIRQVDAARAAMLTCCPPRFISATALLRKIGAGRSTSALKRMPELLQTASAMSETRVAFALRRIAFVQTRLPKGFTRQDLIDASSIRRQLSKNEEVMRLVDEVLRAA